MRDKDIKNIINRASESEEYNINSEEIKNTLLDRIGKTVSLQEAGNEPIVEPIIVTSTRKDKRRTFAKITAGVAAACLGVGIIGAAAYNGFDARQLSALYSNDVYLADLTESAENNTPPSQTETAADMENTTAYETDNELTLSFKEIKGPVEEAFDFSQNQNPGDYEITLLDGTLMQYENEHSTITYYDESPLPIAKEGNRLYFTADGNKRDITDQMLSDKYFCVSYIHPKTGQPHYFIVGGDLEIGFFGYIEFFWLSGDSERVIVTTKYFTENPDKYNLGKFSLYDDTVNNDWISITYKKIFDALKEKYSITSFSTSEYIISDYPNS